MVLADDHPVVRDGLRGMLAAVPGVEVVGEAADGVEAVAVVRATRPDVLLLDLRMPGGDGLDAIAALRGDPVRVLVLSTFATGRDVTAALEAGATGYVLKDTPAAQLVAALRAAAAGESVLSPAVATQVVSRLRGETDGLTDRELAVLRLVAQGTPNRAIAASLFVSEATVKTHLGHVFGKLGATDRAAAVATAYERGILP
ncbi:two component transcriptional regulator, LuxR family [Klenkia marina]|uniref:Two component transcriptional regulator, LuxR family n=1 Tax=Klenkia marina TaxID=1960309 RepID=A0A1G4XUF0_9ACTN|nr:two component transcriptional regulator, LuxR family [Klenkia marina]